LLRIGRDPKIVLDGLCEVIHILGAFLDQRCAEDGLEAFKGNFVPELLINGGCFREQRLMVKHEGVDGCQFVLVLFDLAGGRQLVLSFLLDAPHHDLAHHVFLAHSGDYGMHFLIDTAHFFVALEDLLDGGDSVSNLLVFSQLLLENQGQLGSLVLDDPEDEGAAQQYLCGDVLEVAEDEDHLATLMQVDVLVVESHIFGRAAAGLAR
jgi:hypothetical protein